MDVWTQMMCVFVSMAGGVTTFIHKHAPRKSHRHGNTVYTHMQLSVRTIVYVTLDVGV